MEDEIVNTPKKRSVGPERLWRKVSTLSKMKADLAVLESAYNSFKDLAEDIIGELNEDTLNTLEDLFQKIKSEASAKLKAYSAEVRGNIMDSM